MSDQDKFDRQDQPGSAIQEFAEKIIRRDEAMKENIPPTDREKIAAEPIHIISLGAGVQSSTMALMASLGHLKPMPNCAIFADTKAEPVAVYEWLEYLIPKLAFPVHIVSAGNLYDNIGSKRKRGEFRRVDIPAYVLNPNGKKGGLLNRSCTRDFKITPIRRKVREILGIAGKRSPKKVVVKQWIGISVDEAHRMKPSRESYSENIWPLIDAGMTRDNCLAWMRDHGFDKPPKSSCVFCPFHSDATWRSLPVDEMKKAIEVDDSLRMFPKLEYHSKGTLFLHRSCKPLRDVDFRKPPEFSDGFGNECEGVCGV